MNKRFFFVGGLLSLLHIVATFTCLFLIIFAFMDRYEKYPETGEMTDAIIPHAVLQVLSFPILLAGSMLMKEMPDAVLYVLAGLNSSLWGFGIAYGLKRWTKYIAVKPKLP